MVMRNKNKAAFIFFGLLCGLVYLLGSCSGESDLNGCGDLSIGMQIPMTRSAEPEARDDVDKDSDQIPKEDGECGLYALTDLQKNQNGFDKSRTKECYEKMKQCAMDSMAYKPGEGMPSSTMLSLGQRYGLLTGMTFFDEENLSENYFTQSDNVTNAKIACFQKDGKEHYARITWVSTKKSKVHYVDSEGPGTIDMNELDGVMYYQKKKDEKK